MDIRNPVLAILCGGAPAPGINGVIASITIEALNSNCSTLGFLEGFRQLKQGKSMVMQIEFNDVTRIYNTGGSIIRTSKQQLTTTAHVDNCLRVLQHHRVRYLVTIGGTQTAYSASLVAAAAAAAKYKLSVVHAPKSIFTDLGALNPLNGAIEGVRTFGFSTAREVGMQLVQNLSSDARTMLRWYIIVCMGQKAGHLTLGIGKAGAATLTILAEDYMHRGTPLTFNELASVLEAAIYKRRAMNKEYGVACISEGLVSCLDPKEMMERFGDLDTAHTELGRHLTLELLKRFSKRSPPIEQTVVSRNIGNELRSAPPNASDITLTRDLGFAAVRVLMQAGSEVVVTLKSGQIDVIPFSAILDTAHMSTQIRLVDTNSLSYQVAQSYSIILRQPDLQDNGFLQKLARSANMTASEFILAFQNIAAPMPSFRSAQLSGVSTQQLSGFMQQAFPQIEKSHHAALTQQTQQQLQLPAHSSTHIITPGQPIRKGSDRESFSASPPAHLPNLAGQSTSSTSSSGAHHQQRGSSGGAVFGDSILGASIGPMISPSQAGQGQQPWYQQSRAGEAMQRLSSSSPTPLHLLTNPETPIALNSAGTPRSAFPPFPTPTSMLASALNAAPLTTTNAHAAANLATNASTNTPASKQSQSTQQTPQRKASFEFKQ